MIQSNFQVCIYLFNQIIDIILWTWVSLVMYKRVLCKDYRVTYCLLRDIIAKYKFDKISSKSLKKIMVQNYFIADILLLVASLIAVIQFANQFYFHMINFDDKILQRVWIWMIFHKLITTSILIRYRKYQPTLFGEIKNEIIYIFNKLKLLIVCQKTQHYTSIKKLK